MLGGAFLFGGSGLGCPQLADFVRVGGVAGVKHFGMGQRLHPLVAMVIFGAAFPAFDRRCVVWESDDNRWSLVSGFVDGFVLVNLASVFLHLVQSRTPR